MVSKAPSGGGPCLYRDHSHHTDDDEELKELLSKADTEGVKGTDQTFPVKLHQLLSGSDEDGFSHIVSWMPHGRAFIVKKHDEFVSKVLPCCFRQSKFASFQRQLNLYGFSRITTGRDKGAYYHELFLRGRALLALKMQRTKVKGTGSRKPSQPDTEPDFYAMPFVYEEVSSPKATPPVTSITSRAASRPTETASFLSTYAARTASMTGSPTTLGTSSLFLDPFARLALRGMNESSMGGALGDTLPSLATPANLSNATRQGVIEEMLSRNAQNLRQLSDFHSLDNSSILRGSALAGMNFSTRPGHISLYGTGGPLHTNGLGKLCNCATPAF